jgi:hypothetical protein
MDSITVSAPIGFWTHYRASRAVAARIWSTYVAWAFFFGVPAALLVFMLASHRDITQGSAFGWPDWMLPVVGFLFMAVLMPLLTMLNIYSMRRRNPSIGTQTWVLTPDHYSVSGNLFDTTLKWEAFIKARETRGFFLLYISARWAHFIPKSAVASCEQRSAIRALIQQKRGPKARLANET